MKKVITIITLVSVCIFLIPAEIYSSGFTMAPNISDEACIGIIVTGVILVGALIYWIIIPGIKKSFKAGVRTYNRGNYSRSIYHFEKIPVKSTYYNRAQEYIKEATNKLRMLK